MRGFPIMKKILFFVALIIWGFQIYCMEQNLKQSRSEYEKQPAAELGEPELKQARICTSECQELGQEKEEEIGRSGLPSPQEEIKIIYPEFESIPENLQRYIFSFLKSHNTWSLFVLVRRLANVTKAKRVFLIKFLSNQNVIKYLINTYIQKQFKEEKGLYKITEEVIGSLIVIQADLKRYADDEAGLGLLENIIKVLKPIAQNLAKEYLVSKNVDITNLDEHLFNARRANNDDIVRLLLVAGANPNAMLGTNLDENLFEAIKAHNDDEVKILLAAGANPNAKFGIKQEPALMLAIDNPKIMRTLLLGGADPNEASCQYTIFNRIIYLGDACIVKMFLDFGANPNIKGYHGFTPLMYADALDKLNVLLADERIDPNIQDEFGYTVLMRAIEGEFIDGIQAIVNHPKINLNIKNSEGQTALDIAKSIGNNEIIALIRDSWVKKMKKLFGL